MARTFDISTIFHPRFHSRRSHERNVSEANWIGKSLHISRTSLRLRVGRNISTPYLNFLFFSLKRDAGKKFQLLTLLKRYRWSTSSIEIFETWSRVSSDVFGSLSLLSVVLFKVFMKVSCRDFDSKWMKDK